MEALLAANCLICEFPLEFLVDCLRECRKEQNRYSSDRLQYEYVHLIFEKVHQFRGKNKILVGLWQRFGKDKQGIAE